MEKFKVGDTVRIRTDLCVGSTYDNMCFVGDMRQYMGKESTIREVHKGHDNHYRLHIDSGSWTWSGDMLFFAALKVGDTVRVRADLKHEEYDGGCAVVNAMLQHKGELATITNVHAGGTRYHIAIDKENWNWSESMLELVGKGEHDASTIQAIEESIRHHADNLHVLQESKGNFVRGSSGSHIFLIGDKTVSYNANDCALCRKFTPSFGESCDDCPLYKIGQKCDTADSAWVNIMKSETAGEVIAAEANMVRVLRSLLEKKVEVSEVDALKEENAKLHVEAGQRKEVLAKLNERLDKMADKLRNLLNGVV